MTVLVTVLAGVVVLRVSVTVSVVSVVVVVCGGLVTVVTTVVRSPWFRRSTRERSPPGSRSRSSS